MFGPSQVPTTGEPSGGGGALLVNLSSPSLAISLCKGTGGRTPSSGRFASQDPLRVLLGAAPGAHSRPGEIQARFFLSPTGSAALLGFPAELATDAHLKTCSNVHPASKALGGSFIGCLRRDTLPATLICSWVYSEM